MKNKSDNDKEKVRMIHKSEISRRLYYLNFYIGQLKKQRKECLDEVLQKNISDEIKKLYYLKKCVLIKMTREGFAAIRQMQIGYKSCYCVIRVNRKYDFHLPISKELSELMRKSNENQKNGTKLCTEE